MEEAEKRFFAEHQALQTDADKRKWLMRYAEDHNGCSICGDSSDDIRSIPSLGFSTEVLNVDPETYGDDGQRLSIKFLCYDCAFSLQLGMSPTEFEQWWVKESKPGIYHCNLCGEVRVMFEAEIDPWQKGEHRKCWRQRCTLTVVYCDDIFNCPDCHQRKCKAGQPVCDSCRLRQAYRRGLQEQAEAKTKADIEAARVEREERVRVAEEKFEDRLMNESFSRQETTAKFEQHMAEQKAKRNDQYTTEADDLGDRAE
jgi:hypothetical protein